MSVDSTGGEARGDSSAPALSADGRFVSFTSEAGDLVPGDTNGEADIFVHDRQTGVTERVSVDSTGGQATRPSAFSSLSADGRLVAFDSQARDLDPGDTNCVVSGLPCATIFVHDRQTGTTERVSGSWDSHFPVLSADGPIVAFFTYGTTDDDSVVVHDRQTALSERLTEYGQGSCAEEVPPALSADGHVVAFVSECFLAPEKTYAQQPGVFVRVKTGAWGTTTTTTSPPTTSVTTLPPASTSTTTTLPLCASIRCVIDAARHGPNCGDEVLPRGVATKLGRGVAMSELAPGKTPKKATRLYKSAKRLLTKAGKVAMRVARGRRPKLSGQCAADLRGAASVAIGMLGS